TSYGSVLTKLSRAHRGAFLQRLLCCRCAAAGHFASTVASGLPQRKRPCAAELPTPTDPSAGGTRPPGTGFLRREVARELQRTRGAARLRNPTRDPIEDVRAGGVNAPLAPGSSPLRVPAACTDRSNS